jgi:acetyl/propionyl-CoA carboxylase alpha subunit
VREGDTVTPFYDPMIAKVIAHAATREAAAAKLAGALRHAEIAGLRTNNAFLIRALEHPDFVAGEIDTGFVERHLKDLVPPQEPDQAVLDAAARFVADERPSTDDPWDARDSFRIGGASAQVVRFTAGEGRLNGAARGIGMVRLASGDIAALRGGETYVLRLYDPFEYAESHGVATDRIATPMPGKIIQVLVKEGDAVRKGQPLAVLEAMKMEHTLSAPADATVEAVPIAVGDQVGDGTVVVRFAKQEAA